MTRGRETRNLNPETRRKPEGLTRISGFGFPSGFGFRPSDFLPLLLRVLLLQLVCSSLAADSPVRTIGIEGRASVNLPGPDYQPRPLDDRTELILRLEKVAPLPNGQYRYDFFYMGLEPGHYNLADYLMRPDGSRPDELGDIGVRVRALLPENQDGQLNAYVPRPFPWIGGYRAGLGLLAVLWAAGLAAFYFAFRRKRVVLAPPRVELQPSFAERLRPLVEAAAMGKLTADGKAQLERLMMGYWREKLSLPDLRMAEALRRLKAHADAGQLLRSLEQWLHRQGGASPAEVAAVLEPYRTAPAAAGGVNSGCEARR